MTTNALTFQANQEAKRHNLAMEQYYAKQNEINERQASVAETNAVSNRMQAQASQAQASTASRSVDVTQWYNTGWLAETQRHNTMSENIQKTENVIKAVDVGGKTIDRIIGWFKGKTASAPVSGWSV